ncbi:MFS family permease [Allocatelliglobosispora scoriae]|uniref:MFS family permease n=1 Tax=Allocatelliglobosispora scoriae TaxID=643052 RepID=A0A841BQU8_9ACTN|nr:MFS transporter [Allocatelliglobosispora scoriae]MBB5871427.1 MFS family permease [Allocatelliglobosispora scoriae]
MIRRFYAETAGGLPRAFWTLWTAMLVNRVGAFAMLFLPLYLKDSRGLTLTVIGLVTAGYGIGGACGSLLGGVLADRWGRRSTLLLANGVAATLLLALGFADDLWLIVLLTAATGVFHSMPGPALVAATIDIVPEEARSRAFNLQFWAFNLGTAMAATIAGAIASTSFFALFAVDAAMTAVTATIIYFKIPETVRKEPSTPSSRKRGGLGAAFRDSYFMIFVGLTFVLAFISSQSSMVQLAMNADGLSPRAFGLVMALPGILIVLGQLFVPKLIQGRTKGRVLALAFAFLGVGYAVIGAADIVPMYLLAAAIWTMGSMLAAPPNASVIAELAPPQLRARYQAVFYLVFPAAGFAAPAIGGWSLDHLGSAHWLIIGTLGILAAIGHLLAGPPRERRVAAALAATTPPVPAAPPTPQTENSR